MNKMKLQRSTKIIFAIIIIILMIVIITSLYLNYRVKYPKEAYRIDRENLVLDGSFEDFNQTAGDCCNADPSRSKVFASKSTDAFDGRYSLNLTSRDQCACINKPSLDTEKNKKYLIYFSYKGSNPRYCNWVQGDNSCLQSGKLGESSEWMKYWGLLKYTNKSESSAIFFYADSNGYKSSTNLYDDLQIHKIYEISIDLQYNENEQYVILTDPSNVVHNGEQLNDEGYYLVTGKPDITLRFPWAELVILLFMMLVVIRLLFKNPEKEIK